MNGDVRQEVPLAKTGIFYAKWPSANAPENNWRGLVTRAPAVLMLRLSMAGARDAVDRLL
jgi:hypothetical protein